MWRNSAFEIEADLGVEHQQLAVFRHRQRVDLDLRGVGAEERVVQLRCDVRRLLGEIAGQAQCRRDGAAVVRHEAGGGIDREGLDLLGRVVGDGFDVHAALCRDDEGDLPGGAIDQQREIEFARDIDAVGDVEAVDLLAGVAGLDRHQRVAQHVGCRRANLILGLRQPHAALGVRPKLLELALAASAGMDLRLDHIKRPGQRLRRRDRFLHAHRRMAGGNGHAELRQQFLGLIFVDVHGGAVLVILEERESLGLKHIAGGESTPARVSPGRSRTAPPNWS